MAVQQPPPATTVTNGVEAILEEKTQQKVKKQELALSRVLQDVNPKAEYSFQSFQNDLKDPNLMYACLCDSITNQKVLKEQLDRDTAKNEELQRRSKAMKDIIAGLNTVNDSLKKEPDSNRQDANRIQLPAAEETPTPPSLRLSYILPDPPFFYGGSGDKLNFECWMVRLKTKLEYNADHFTDPKLKLAYVASLLMGCAAKYTMPRLIKDSYAPYQDVNELLDHMKQSYTRKR